MPQDVFEALQQELDQLENMLESLDAPAWDTGSRCDGWSVADVVLHLAQTEEVVVAVVTGAEVSGPALQEGTSADERMARWVAEERGGSPQEVLSRWKTARRAAFEALTSADPGNPVPWVAAPLKPRTMATTRLSEHWIHAHDIADPLGIDYPDSERLWHICRLAHRTLPYAYSRAGRGTPPDVYLELTGPSGDAWSFGDEGSPVTIRGAATEFCRVAGRRLPFEQAKLDTTGKEAADVLRLVRTYA